MKSLIFTIVCLLIASLSFGKSKNSLLVETESFTNKGGWVVDQQSMDVMGSPYLMAHGIGIPVKDASTTIAFPKKGAYKIFVRTRNWTAPWSDEAAGQFEVLIDGEKIGGRFGVRGKEWQWIEGGTIEISSTNVELKLHDLTGFNGRCDAIYFTQEYSDTPPDSFDELEAFRKEMLGLKDDPIESNYDFVIVGGGHGWYVCCYICSTPWSGSCPRSKQAGSRRE